MVTKIWRILSNRSEIAAALQKTSATARLAGVDLDQMAAIITVVSEKMRAAPETIGSAWKTILTRMQNVKIGKYFDEEGESISDVEKVLGNLGIRLRDDNDTFRDMGDVLDETMVLWKQLSLEGKTVEMGLIANAFAGTRQSEVFKTLMDNQESYTEALKIEAESLGLVEQRYRLYSDSIEATKNRFTAAWEEMVQKTVSSDMVKTVTEVGIAILNIISNLNGLPNVLMAIAAAIAVINMQSIIGWLSSMAQAVSLLVLNVRTLSGGLTVLSGVFKGLTVYAAISTAGLAALAAGIILLRGVAENAAHAMTNLYDTFEKAKNETSSNQDELKTLAERYEALSQKQEKSIDDITELLDIQSILNTKYGALESGINSYTDAISGNSEAIQENIEWIKKKALQEAESFIEKNKYAYEDATTYLTSPAKIEEQIPGMNQLAPRELLKWYDEYISKNGDATGSIRKNREALLEQISAAERLQYEFEHYTNIIKANTSAVEENSSESGSTSEQLKAHAEEIEKLSELADVASKTVTSSFDAITNALNQFNETGSYSLSTAQSLIEAGYAEAISINAVTGEVSINIPMLQQLAIAQIDAAMGAKQHVYDQMTLAEQVSTTGKAILAEIDVLEVQRKAFEGEFTDTKALLDVLNSFSGAKISSAGASGGATEASKKAKKAYEDEKDSLDDQIDALKDQKDALKDSLDAYKDIIDAQKQKLRLNKEEEDYEKGLTDRNRDLAKIDRELLELQFDNSEEANAKRLQLEEDRAKATEDIAEYQADRTYDIEVQALDAEYDAFERVINLQMAGIDAMIDKYGEMIDQINKAISALSEMSSAGGGGYVIPTSVPVPTSSNAITRQVWDALVQSNRSRLGGYSSGGMGKIPSGHPNDSALLPVESDEAFIIFNKQQQDMMSKNSFFPSMKFPSLTSAVTDGESGVSIGDIVFQVSGNMDKSIVPQIKPLILDAVNDALKNRGIRRNATSFSI